MSFKTILVHVDNSRRCNARIDAALQVASDHGAHLVGLYVSHMPVAYGLPVTGGMEALVGLMLEEEEANRAAARKRFEERARPYDQVSSEWRCVEGVPEDMLGLHARYADLVVCGQTDPEDNFPYRPYDFPAALTLSAPRPVLVMPHSGQLPSVGRNVLVAWNASNEATRAITDALPLLKRAKTVTVLVVNPSHGFAEHGQVPGADIALYLARHGVNAEVSCDENVEADIGEWLLSRAADLGSDLIVMGAYGHRRLREWALGGATRTLAGEMTVPVLMSH